MRFVPLRLYEQLVYAWAERCSSCSRILEDRWTLYRRPILLRVVFSELSAAELAYTRLELPQSPLFSLALLMI